MKKIYKYDITLCEYQLIEMPIGAEILSIGLQNDSIKLWAMVEPEQYKLQIRHILIVGTGQGISNDAKQFIGTVQQGAFVWHLFEC